MATTSSARRAVNPESRLRPGGLSQMAATLQGIAHGLAELSADRPVDSSEPADHLRDVLEDRLREEADRLAAYAAALYAQEQARLFAGRDGRSTETGREG